MDITRTVMKNLFLYTIIIVALLLIVLFPRNPAMSVSGKALTVEMEYHFSWKEYKNNVIQYLQHVWKEKSLGETRHERVMVEDEIMRFLPNSLKIILPAFFISLLFGIWKGIFDYKNRRNKKNIFGNGLTWILQSIPDFFIVICLQWLVIFTFPSLKLFSQTNWYGFIIPAILVSVYPMMYMARITSAALSNEDGQYYIQVAKAKGFPMAIVTTRHILRNSLQSILPHITSLMIHTLSSLLIVEYLIGYEGLAYRLFTALGFTTSFNMGSFRGFEPGVIIGIGLCFLSLVILAQLTGFIIKRSLRLP
ncbi:oligopeptide transport system permease protein [Cytobacillus eiseniae]|uniref:Oligopeptide transport system permease protein n=1 Tax=Cytobacillus eiseniae TaxID=762947 RepID=A0ABS4RJT0_9BACI|nr:ABC transporter permease [Cytobacillus eiseniae]MBP2243160.1 oligopeptide transport system permease protein [Cytobacillus eiseniae]